MRDLYKEIQEFYLLGEGLSKQPSSPIIDSKEDDMLGGKHKDTNLVRYFHDPMKDESISPNNYSGTHHYVAWNNHKSKDSMSDKEKKDSLHDAMHLHNHFVKHNTEIGDLVSNKPDKDADGGNRRARIYAKKAGFSDQHENEHQYGIVKQHPEDHPEEHLRGEKYLHPLNQNELQRRK